MREQAAHILPTYFRHVPNNEFCNYNHSLVWTILHIMGLLVVLHIHIASMSDQNAKCLSSYRWLSAPPNRIRIPRMLGRGGAQWSGSKYRAYTRSRHDGRHQVRIVVVERLRRLPWVKSHMVLPVECPPQMGDVGLYAINSHNDTMVK